MYQTAFGTLKESLADKPIINPNTKIYIGTGWMKVDINIEKK